MRPYNNYRNPELSQPVSSVENTLTDRASNSNASFDLLRSLSESISVDCGSFDISTPTEYYQTSSAPSHVAFVDPRGKEIRTPVESAPAAPVSRESAKSPVKPSVNAAADMDDDDYDCMNDPNYRTQNVKESDSPSFEELLARTAESIAKMREESCSEISNSEAPKRETTNQNNHNTIHTETKSDAKPSETASSKKRFGANISWAKTRKALFSRETIKLAFLSIAISALIVSAVIYKKSSRSNGLPESGDVVVTQSVSRIQSVPVQENEIAVNNNESKAADDGDFWKQPNNDWNDPAASNRQAMTDSFQDDYQSPMFNDKQYSQNESNGYLPPEDAGRQLAPPHNSNNGNQFVDAMPTFNAGPQYAEVSPALGAQYSPDEYESPVLEDDSVSEYSETGYNSNFMR